MYLKCDSHRGRGWPGKTAGGIGFALNFLWLLSFFQEKESNKAAQTVVLVDSNKLLNKVAY